MHVNTADAQIKRRIGVQLQNTRLLPDLTVVEQVKLFATLYGRPLSHGDCLDLLEWVGLVEKANALQRFSKQRHSSHLPSCGPASRTSK
jgi:ABC-type multidrug transport system ATPase subunit